MSRLHTPMGEYRWLESVLLKLREDGFPESDEDPILDQMDEVWKKLSDDERRELTEEGATCWPRGRGD